MYSKFNPVIFPLAREKIFMDPQIQKKCVSIENDSLQANLFEKFLDPNLPICVICCEGKVGAGKSTLMSLIALHLDSTIPTSQLFEASAHIYSGTSGCSVLNKKFIFNGVQIVLIDFEGQGGITDSSRNMDDSEYEQYLNKLMCLSFVIPSVLIIVSQQRIEKVDIDRLKYLESIHRRMTNSKINLPHFKWFIREGGNLLPKQLADFSTRLQVNCPSVFQNTNLLFLPQLDQQTLIFAKRQKFQVIEDLLRSATSDPQNLPRKSQFLRIFNDTFSLINHSDFEVAYGQRLGYYRVLKEWDKTERPKYEQAEKKLSLNCEKVNDNGEQYEIGYRSMIQIITQDINNRLENDGISSYSFSQELNLQIQSRFDIIKAKMQYLTRKEEKQAIQKERNEAENRRKVMDRKLQESQKQTLKLEQQHIENEKKRKEERNEAENRRKEMDRRLLEQRQQTYSLQQQQIENEKIIREEKYLAQKAKYEMEIQYKEQQLQIQNLKMQQQSNNQNDVDDGEVLSLFFQILFIAALPFGL